MLMEQFNWDGWDPEFQPVGEDSWSYRSGSFWITVRRDVQGHVPAAYEAAHHLKSLGYEFVVAPLAGVDGRVVHSVQGFPVIVYPFVRAPQIADGSAATSAELAVIADMVSRIHQCAVPLELPIEDFGTPIGEQLAELIASAARADPQTGPFSSRLNQLLAAHADRIATLRSELAYLASRCAADRRRFKLTHGDLNTTNILRHGERLLMVDWGQLKWGPEERDWYHLNRTFGAGLVGRPEMMRFYHLRWQISEIAEYVGVFTTEHTDDADCSAMWRRLVQCFVQP
ncbi:MAG: phosphotransferase [Mycobacterium sp.]